MAISWNTGATASANTASSCAITIPAGVLTGDVMLLGIACFTEVSSAPTISFSGGGGGWTAITITGTGSNPEQATNGTLYSYGFVYYRVATAGDPGASLTVSESGSPAGTTWWALALGSYTGAATTQADVAASNAANQVLTNTSPTVVTGVANDWSIGFELGGTNTAPSSFPSTTRENITSSAGITAALWDSNGSVGAAGTTIGGVTVHGGNGTAGNNWTDFTVGLQPPTGTAVSGTVQPWATVQVPRRKAARGIWGGIKGPAFVAVAAPRQEPQTLPRRESARGIWGGPRPFTGFVQVVAPQQEPPIPRRTSARAVWRGSVPFTGFVAVPAPKQEPPVPRRRPARAVIEFTPVTTTNATTPSVSGTVQPWATVQVPRRTRARGAWGGPRPFTGFAFVPAPRQQITIPRRRPARAYIQFTPVRTTNQAFIVVPPPPLHPAGGYSMLKRTMLWADL